MGCWERRLMLKIPFQVCYLFKNYFIVCVYDTQLEGHTCVWRGQRTPYGVCPCLPAFCLLWGSYPGCQDFEPSCWSLRSSVFLKRIVQACCSKHYLTDESKRMFVSNQRWMSATSVREGKKCPPFTSDFSLSYNSQRKLIKLRYLFRLERSTWWMNSYWLSLPF